MERYKYPRTPHLPFSDTITQDDKRLSTDLHFYNMRNVVVTYKMDGENTTIYSDGKYHARSIDSSHRDYHSWLLGYIQNWCYMIPQDLRVCGEYMYAKHSIGYDNLPSYFLVFSVWNKDICLSWDETVALTQRLGLYTVPVLYVGRYDTDLILRMAKQAVLDGQEGVVVRNADSFNLKDFSSNVAKYVRPNHVQTDTHWSSCDIIKNGLAKIY